MIVRGQRNKQNRNRFYFNLSFKSSSFILNNFKTEKFKLTFEGWNRPVCNLMVLPECLSVKIAFHPRTVKRIVVAPMPSLLFRCFFLFLPHLRTLAQEKRSEIAFVLGLGGESLFLSIIVARYLNVFPQANDGRSREKKNFWQSDLLAQSECTIEIWSTLT